MEADLAAVLGFPHPDGLGPDGGDRGPVAVVLAFDPNCLASPEPALLIKQLPVLDSGLDPRRRGTSQPHPTLKLLLDRTRGRSEAESHVDNL